MGPGQSTVTVPNTIQESGSKSVLNALICHSRVLTDAEKYELLTTPQTGLRDTELDTRYFEVNGK